MINGLVLEIKKKKLIVLTSSGEYLTCKKPNSPVEIGQEISLPLSEIINDKTFRIQLPKLYGVIIACAMILFAIFGYNLNSDQAMAAAYVTINSNAKVKATVNKYLEVIDVKYMDETGESVVQDLKGWKHKSIKSVVTEIIKISNKKNFLQTNDTVTIETKMKKSVDKTREKLEHQLNEVQLENRNYKINVNKLTHNDVPVKKNHDEMNLKQNTPEKNEPHKEKLVESNFMAKSFSNNKCRAKKVESHSQRKITKSVQNEKKKPSVHKDEHNNHSVKVNMTYEYNKKIKSLNDNQFKYKYDHKHHKEYEHHKFNKEKSHKDKEKNQDNQDQDEDQ
ncbi:anti-sigma factor domain-containing protein [Bacillus sp. RG28]|uniref:Anti-sigma factor domain-containing protein n=1 Tax=Gottfriedia endophytica TaxID=2820819 RepID=A0A940NJ24_9BACI|nr:anti-sigma factor domain-containing protein [Gottfriedia endophytica]MBP0725022.1 anti-sigma factor domain-containing protein [Gottfriedia endophytica]